jgi:chromosome partitioning protein
VSIIAVANQKGGVGKTTSTLNLAAALQEAGKRVLLIDLDPQGSLSVAAGILDIDAAYPSIGDLLSNVARGRGGKPLSIKDAIIVSPAGLDLVPANLTLSAAELALVPALNRESALAGLLKPVEADYDYIVIDCLPSLGLLAINALRVATGIVIPVQADYLAMHGLAQFFETIAAVRESLNPNLRILGVLLTLVNQRTAHSREVVRLVRTSLAGQVNVFNTEIRSHVALKDTARAGRSILEYDSRSPSAKSYRALAVEVLGLLDDKVSAPLVMRPVALVAKAQAPEPEPEPEPVPQPVAPAPLFQTFVGDGWQRWLGKAS